MIVPRSKDRRDSSDFFSAFKFKQPLQQMSSLRLNHCAEFGVGLADGYKANGVQETEDSA